MHGVVQSEHGWARGVWRDRSRITGRGYSPLQRGITVVQAANFREYDHAAFTNDAQPDVTQVAFTGARQAPQTCERACTPASLVPPGIAIVRRPALETVAMATEQRRSGFGEGQVRPCESNVTWLPLL